MLDNNPVRKGTVEHLAGHELLELHLGQQFPEHLLHHILPVPMLVNYVSQHTRLLLGNGLDVLFVTAKTDVAVDVAGVLMRGLLGGGLGFCCEEFAR